MKNILYTIILSFLFSFSVFAEDDVLLEYAKQGHANAQHNLGLIYYRGDGVAQDYKEAIKWLRLSSEQGYVYAQVNLGNMYIDGKGVTQDFIIAHMWFNVAGSNGLEYAPALRDKIAKRMTPEQLAKAQKLASECIKKNYKNCG